MSDTSADDTAVDASRDVHVDGASRRHPSDQDTAVVRQLDDDVHNQDASTAVHQIAGVHADVPGHAAVSAGPTAVSWVSAAGICTWTDDCNTTPCLSLSFVHLCNIYNIRVSLSSHTNVYLI